MAGCEAKLSSGKKGPNAPALRVCGMRAVVKTPPDFDGPKGVWFCAEHAPMRLLPKTLKGGA